MSFLCMCASEECAVLGCKRYRDIVRRAQVPEPIGPGPVASVGWLCPRCGGSNGPAVLACMHCLPPSVTTNRTDTP